MAQNTKVNKHKQPITVLQNVAPWLLQETRVRFDSTHATLLLLSYIMWWVALQSLFQLDQ